jgi:hypothetical protein
MSRITLEMRSRYSTEKVYGVVLAASEQAVMEFAYVGRLVHHHLTAAFVPRLDFDPALPIDVGRDEFTVRSHTSALPPISFQVLRYARKRMAALFPVETVPWMPARPISASSD